MKLHNKKIIGILFLVMFVSSPVVDIASGWGWIIVLNKFEITGTIYDHNGSEDNGIYATSPNLVTIRDAVTNIEIKRISLSAGESTFSFVEKDEATFKKYLVEVWWDEPFNALDRADSYIYYVYKNQKIHHDFSVKVRDWVYETDFTTSDVAGNVMLYPHLTSEKIINFDDGWVSMSLSVQVESSVQANAQGLRSTYLKISTSFASEYNDPNNNNKDDHKYAAYAAYIDVRVNNHVPSDVTRNQFRWLTYANSNGVSPEKFAGSSSSLTMGDAEIFVVRTGLKILSKYYPQLKPASVAFTLASGLMKILGQQESLIDSKDNGGLARVVLNPNLPLWLEYENQVGPDGQILPSSPLRHVYTYNYGQWETLDGGSITISAYYAYVDLYTNNVIIETSAITLTL